MPRKPVPDPEKYCERCGLRLQRKRYGNDLEDMGRFLTRRFCSLRCSNSRGIRSQGLKQQHKISLTFRKERCESCGRRPDNPQHLHVHHINEDWTDHRPENLKTLCVGCHLILHRRRSPICQCCDAISRKHGMCQKHYQRWKKYGDPFLTKKRVKGTPNGHQIVREYSTV